MKERDLIRFFQKLGIDVHTTTKARGHGGFCLKNRIDISKNLSEERRIPTLIHEFAHFIHSKIENGIEKNGGNLSVIFKSENPILFDELVEVTHFVDENSLCQKLYEHKKIIKQKILEEEKIIKEFYPKFLRSKRFKEFEKYIKHSEARYLLKYDRVKIVTGFFRRKSRIFSITNLENDFPDIPKAFSAYIRLKSYQKKQSKISSRINRYQKYYARPTELFARFVEGLYHNKDMIKDIAPNSYARFFELLNDGYYKELRQLPFLNSVQKTYK